MFLAIQHEGSAARGWGIPMATDIAFVVGCMAVLGKRVPHGLRVMLLTLAIADDIGAILVIAIGYSTGVDLTVLAWAGGGLLTIIILARLGCARFSRTSLSACSCGTRFLSRVSMRHSRAC